MFILYIDDSGSEKNANEHHVVLAGFAIFERQIYHVINDLDKVVDGFGIGDASEIELHGSPMYTGKTLPWRSEKDREKRNQMIQDALAVLTRASKSVKAFGVVVEKKAVAEATPIEYAFEQICSRFNHYLTRLYQSRGGRDEDKQKGLIVMDESHHEKPLQAMARDFRLNGTRWGHLRNIAEVPLFIDSKASRLIQLADLIAFSMWRKYEYQDGRFFDPIIERFDADGGVIHGLVHCKVKGRECYCPACMSRSVYIKEGKSGKMAALGAVEGNVPSDSSHKSQIEKSKQTARELGCDDDETTFRERFKKLTEASPPESVEKRKSKVNLTKKDNKS